jgi:hypothetical protein
MRIDIYHHFDDAATVLKKLLIKGEQIMATQAVIQAKLAEIVAVVRDTKGKVASLNALMDGMRAQITQLLEGNIPDAVMTDVQTVFDEAQAVSADAQAAIDENPV